LTAFLAGASFADLAALEAALAGALVALAAALVLGAMCSLVLSPSRIPAKGAAL
jgi:hypothetical protein